MIDLHIHGGFGLSFHRGKVEDNLKIASKLKELGIEWILATIIALPPEKLKKALSAIRDAMKETDVIKGAYIEGPFINHLKTGGIPVEFIKSWDIETFKRVIEEYTDTIKIVTLAPELKESKYLRDFLKDKGIKVAIGHSLATYGETVEFTEKGVDLATHIFNAMREFHHREPGIVGAILESSIPCEIIAEKHHLHPTTTKLVYRIKGKESVIPISDATSLAGYDKKEGIFGGRKIINKDGACFTEDGKLYGSATLLLDGLKHLTDLGVYNSMSEAKNTLMRTIEKLKIL
jgi:N-acetylglucosamine-6-phosphate deacetylase